MLLLAVSRLFFVLAAVNCAPAALALGLGGPRWSRTLLVLGLAGALAASLAATAAAFAAVGMEPAAIGEGRFQVVAIAVAFAIEAALVAVARRRPRVSIVGERPQIVRFHEFLNGPGA